MFPLVYLVLLYTFLVAMLGVAGGTGYEEVAEGVVDEAEVGEAVVEEVEMIVP